MEAEIVIKIAADEAWTALPGSVRFGEVVAVFRARRQYDLGDGTIHSVMVEYQVDRSVFGNYSCVYSTGADRTLVPLQAATEEMAIDEATGRLRP